MIFVLTSLGNGIPKCGVISLPAALAAVRSEPPARPAPQHSQPTRLRQPPIQNADKLKRLTVPSRVGCVEEDDGCEPDHHRCRGWE